MISSTTQQDDDQVPLQELRFKTLKRRWYMLLICGLMGTLQVCMCFVYLIVCIINIHVFTLAHTCAHPCTPAHTLHIPADALNLINHMKLQ